MMQQFLNNSFVDHQHDWNVLAVLNTYHQWLFEKDDRYLTCLRNKIWRHHISHMMMHILKGCTLRNVWCFGAPFSSKYASFALNCWEIVNTWHLTEFLFSLLFSFVLFVIESTLQFLPASFSWHRFQIRVLSDVDFNN